VYYLSTNAGWERHVLDGALLPIEAGGATHDIDGDGDLDLVMGEDASGNHVYWWENPYPNFEQNWKRYVIKDSGGNKHHDQIFGDFDGDGADELVFWNQHDLQLYRADIPSSPKETQPWPYASIYTFEKGKESEGLAKADVNLDGKLDIIGGGGWFEHIKANQFKHHIIDASMHFTRSGAAQLVEGGRPEILFVPGDADGPLMMYEWKDGQWQGKKVFDEAVIHGHSLQIADMNQDGHLDIFNAEMHTPGNKEQCKSRIFYGDGNGNFRLKLVSMGIGNHESRLADLDGDGDLDILTKPYTWDAPRLDIFLNPLQ
ncbi:VCBS repeat-containing protein, partial [bacterium]|nr:VCBS repeat-containing protein [bacterium]